jgi:outer membrane protein OmpA-like peptidoglycan-associated protein
VAALDDLVAFNGSLGVAAHDYVRFDLGLPVFVAAAGLDPDVNDSAIGDLRVGTMIMMVRPRHVVGGGGGGLALAGHLRAPTGDEARFLGASGVAGDVALSGTYELDDLTLTAEAGVAVEPKVKVGNITGSNAVSGGVAVGYLLGPNTGLTAETATKLPWSANPVGGTGTPTEIMLSLRQHADPRVHFTLGTAAAVTEGVGAARFRVFAGLGVRSVAPPRQPDADPLGAFVSLDKCPAAPETTNGWQDDDGCPDTLAALQIRTLWQGQPVEGAKLDIVGPAGTRNEITTLAGVSIDAVPGTSWSATATHVERCLSGNGMVNAGDGPTEMAVEMRFTPDASVRVELTLPEDTTELPAESILAFVSDNPSCTAPVPVPITQVVQTTGVGRGTHTAMVSVPGYAVHEESFTVQQGGQAVLRVALEPTLVLIADTKIEIREKVHFESAGAAIKPESFALLDEVAKVIAAHPNIGRIEVQGHTDNRGSEKYNLTLSDKRANSVVAYLVGQGVDAARVMARGYGEAKPIDTNRTDLGRAANRRVEFQLVDRTPEDGEAP